MIEHTKNVDESDFGEFHFDKRFRALYSVPSTFGTIPEQRRLLSA